MTNKRTLALLAATLTLSTGGCGNSAPLPIEPVGLVQPPSATPAPVFPAASATAQVYDRISPSYIQGPSRYVLNTDGTFSLQYMTSRFGFLEYKGRFKRTGSAVVFDWDGWSSAGAWGADGVIAGDSLTVKYNEIMMLTDFEDGVFVRSSGPR